MTPEVTSKHLDDFDIILAKYRLLPENSYMQSAFMNMLDGAQVLTAMFGEKRDKDKPVIQKPSQDKIVEFTEGILADIENLSANIRKDAEIINIEKSYNKIPSSVIYLMSWAKIEQSKLYVKVYLEEAKSEKKEFDEYEARLKAAKNVVIIINEDMNHKLAEHMLKSIWPTIYEKDAVYIHNEWKPRVSEFMKAPNIFFDALHCEDCLKKFNLDETIFFTMGFRPGTKLPIELPEGAYYVGI